MRLQRQRTNRIIQKLIKEGVIIGYEGDYPDGLTIGVLPPRIPPTPPRPKRIIINRKLRQQHVRLLDILENTKTLSIPIEVEMTKAGNMSKAAIQYKVKQQRRGSHRKMR